MMYTIRREDGTYYGGVLLRGGRRWVSDPRNAMKFRKSEAERFVAAWQEGEVVRIHNGKGDR